MDLKFGKSAKILRDAVNSKDSCLLLRLYPQNAEMIMMALQVLRQAKNLNEVMTFAMFRPHALQDGTETPSRCQLVDERD